MLRKPGSKLPIVLLMMFLLNLFSVLPVWAEAGTGDGSGGGQNVALGLASSSPADGATGVAVTGQIKLTFNKNVINMSVKDNNLKCFALYGNGQQVPINVVMADDQIQPEYKRLVTVVPQQPLKPGSKYTLKIAPELQAKSGAVLGREATVTFTTAGVSGENTAPAPIKKSSGDSVKPPAVSGEPDNSKSALVNEQPTSTDKSKEEPAKQQVDTASNNPEPISSNQVEPVEKPQPDQAGIDNKEESGKADAANNPSSSQGGFSKTAIAAIAGALLVALLFYLFMRRKH